MTKIPLEAQKMTKIPPKPTKWPKYPRNPKNYQNTPETQKWPKYTWNQKLPKQHQNPKKMTKIPLKPKKWPKYPRNQKLPKYHQNPKNDKNTSETLKKKKLKIEKIQYLLMNWNLIYISWKITRKLHGFDLRYNLRKVHLVS